MKESRYFYVPDASSQSELPEKEAQHALRVLRLKAGDEIVLIDGVGSFHEAVVTHSDKNHCLYSIQQSIPQQRQWAGHLHLAIAPTKTIERMEWLVEKAVEVGVDEISFLSCQFSERRVIKTERLQKIAISAMKQSRKAWLPDIHEMVSLSQFLQQHAVAVESNQPAQRYIAHCYEEVPRVNLFDALRKSQDCRNAIVLVGPEGDFSIDEVRQAVADGFVSVDLGQSRLRTETAGLAAVMMMHLSAQ